MRSLSDTQFEAALQAVETSDSPAEEKAEMLMEIGMGLQQRPKHSKQIDDAIYLYEKALDVCPERAVVLRGRIRARYATALQSHPAGNITTLVTAREAFNDALKVFREFGLKTEEAETELNLGLVSQSLAQSGAARLTDAIGHYHNALKVFNKDDHPQDYAVIHNNLAIVYLSMQMNDETGKMREALAVQSFEEVLKVINIVDHPSEYAMIQNNLGNALQYASSSHVIENNLRALEAYDEALKVRNPDDTPMEYANTIANKANVLRALPDHPGDLPADESNLRQARRLYSEAKAIFERSGQMEGAASIEEMLAEIDMEITNKEVSVGSSAAGG